MKRENLILENQATIDTEESTDLAISDSSSDLPSPEIRASLISEQEVYPLIEKHTRIGRRHTNDIVIPRSTVSRTHAEIIADGDTYILRDLKSSNGVYINGVRIETEELKNNDRITLDQYGKVSFRFEIVEQYTAIDSSNPREHFEKAIALQRAGRLSSAIQEFLAAIQCGEKSARPHFNLAVIRFHKGGYEQAIKHYQEGIAIEPDNIAAHADLGKLYEVTEQWEQAIEHLKRALELNPEYTVAQRRLTRVQEVQQAYHESDTQFREETELVQSTCSSTRLDELARDLMVAAEVQQRLLPQPPDIPDLDIAVRTFPAQGVSGDYYDFVSRDGQLWITIGDVSGKSIGGAILMSGARASLRTNINHGLPLAEVIAQVNKTIFEDTAPEKFITMFLGVLELSNKTFNYCNAGHNPPILFLKQSRQLDTLDVGGLLVGMLPDAPYETASITLERGDALLFYTDGITEATNDKDELFGEERLRHLFIANADLHAQCVIDAICERVQEFTGGSFQDDATLVVVKINDA